jgi:ppGpp synthetase/RelA/SpoT-type nucleotidyltranferase
MNSIKNLLFISMFLVSCGIAPESTKKTSFQSDVLLYQQYRRKALEISKDMREAFLELQTKFEKSSKDSWCVVTPPKSFNSVERKMNVRNITMEEITDFSRGAFIVSSESEVQQVRNFFVQKFGAPLIDRDNFAQPKRSGYRDYNLVFEDKKFKMPFEVQIHLCNIMLIKDIEHIFYEILNLIDTLSKGNPHNIKIIYNKLKEAIKIFLIDGNNLNPIEFNKVQKAYKIWDSEKTNSLYIKYFVTSITKFINNLYKAVLNDYASKKSKCKINGIDNKKCSLDDKKLRQEGFEYIRSVWK